MTTDITPDPSATPIAALPAWARSILTEARLHHPTQIVHLVQLTRALGPVVPSHDEQRTLTWLAEMWDQPTIAAIEHLILRCRKETHPEAKG